MWCLGRSLTSINTLTAHTKKEDLSANANTVIQNLLPSILPLPFDPVGAEKNPKEECFPLNILGLQSLWLSSTTWHKTVYSLFLPSVMIIWWSPSASISSCLTQTNKQATKQTKNPPFSLANGFSPLPFFVDSCRCGPDWRCWQGRRTAASPQASVASRAHLRQKMYPRTRAATHLVIPWRKIVFLFLILLSTTAWVPFSPPFLFLSLLSLLFPSDRTTLLVCWRHLSLCPKAQTRHMCSRRPFGGWRMCWTSVATPQTLQSGGPPFSSSRTRRRIRLCFFVIMFPGFVCVFLLLKLFLRNKQIL